MLQFLFFPSFPLGLFQIPNSCGLPHVYAPILTCLQWGHIEKNQRIGTFSDCKSQPCLSLCDLRTWVSSLSTLVSARVGLLMPPHELWGWSSPARTPSMAVVVWPTFYLPCILDMGSGRFKFKAASVTLSKFCYLSRLWFVHLSSELAIPSF